jgi:hypothetical protein
MESLYYFLKRGNKAENSLVPLRLDTLLEWAYDTPSMSTKEARR